MGDSNEKPTVEADEDVYYYYCVGGRIELAWELNSAINTAEVTCTSVGPGDFVNGLSLLALFGQAHVGLALKDGTTAMRLCANQSCLHTIYRDALPLEMRCRFDEACKIRRQHNLSPLPRDAASQRRSFFQQWILSHVSWRDLWEPSPLERAMNALQIGSQEWEQMHKLRASSELMEQAEQHDQAMTPEVEEGVIVTTV